MTPVHLRPEGRGTVRLGSPDPFAWVGSTRSPWPAVLFDYLETEYDIRPVLFGLRLVRRIAEQPALQPYVASEIFPGVDIQSDDALLENARQTGASTPRARPISPTPSAPVRR
jgi:choline dehydrogenase